MNLYAFELGRLKDISLAELASIFGSDAVKALAFEYAILDLGKFGGKNPDDTALALKRLQNRLGGTIKIAKVLEIIEDAPTSHKEFESDISNALEQILNEHLEGRNEGEGKLHFAISLINIAGDSKVFLKFFLNFCKDFLKEHKVSSRFVNKPWENPTPAQIYKSRTLEKGLDITIINAKSDDGKNTIYICKTTTIQDIDLYSMRDYEKPFRDTRMGMLPPKLAQIMINLAEQNTSANTYNPQPDKPIQTIYDPFCGSGTILMEGLLQRKAVYGSDIDEKAVEGTKINLNWIIENSNDNTGKDTFEVSQKDVQDLTNKDYPKNLDAIVSETYLGPSQSRVPRQEEQSKIFDSLAQMHENWLSTISENTKVVLAIPAFRIARGSYNRFTEFFQIAKDAGLKLINIKPLIYDRDDQIVAREIVVMEK